MTVDITTIVVMRPESHQPIESLRSTGTLTLPRKLVSELELTIGDDETTLTKSIQKHEVFS